jgi:hypothetical protein
MKRNRLHKTRVSSRSVFLSTATTIIAHVWHRHLEGTMFRPTLFAAIFIVFAVAASAHADELFEDFDVGSVSPNDLVLNTPDGFEINFLNGKAEFVKTDGTGNGFARLSHRMTAVGDFSVTVDVDRVMPSAGIALGVAAGHLGPVTGFSDIYFSGDTTLASLFLIPPFSQPVFIGTSTGVMTFRLRRVGETITHEYDDGGGFQQFGGASHADLAGPVRINLLLGEEKALTTPLLGTFDNLLITADLFLPPCGNGFIGGEEACDDGDSVWATGEFCTATCELVACGDPDNSAALTATDALFVLRAGLGLTTCDACVCDVNASGGATPITASDALIVLSEAVGLAPGLSCSACF